MPGVIVPDGGSLPHRKEEKDPLRQNNAQILRSESLIDYVSLQLKAERCVKRKLEEKKKGHNLLQLCIHYKLFLLFILQINSTSI